MKSAAAVPVLMYHHVTPAPGLVTVSPETFRAQVAWLARNGWQGIGAEDLAGFLAGRPLPPKSVMLTFDDGYLDNWVHAHPVLQEFGFKAVLFVVTGWLGDGPVRSLAGTPGAPACPDHKTCKQRIREDRHDEVILRWSEAEAMRRAGTFELHSHTHSHTRWDQQIADPAARDGQLAADLARSRTVLAAWPGGASSHLCWPQGYHDAQYRRVAGEQGFTHLYTTEPGVVRPGSDRTTIARIVVKDRPASWLASRLWLYTHPLASRLYPLVRALG